MLSGQVMRKKTQKTKGSKKEYSIVCLAKPEKELNSKGQIAMIDYKYLNDMGQDLRSVLGFHLSH